MAVRQIHICIPLSSSLLVVLLVAIVITAGDFFESDHTIYIILHSSSETGCLITSVVQLPDLTAWEIIYELPKSLSMNSSP